MNSILDSIKKMLGLEPDYKAFDMDIVMLINSALLSLNQIGVGPETGFTVADDKQTWDEFIGGRQDVDAVISYVYMRVKMIFDPPSSSSAMEAMKQTVEMLEWRINVQVENSPID